MGRHSLDSAPPAPAAGPAPREAAAPVTDPVLLDAVQRELRRMRVEEPPTTAVPRRTRRIETPFSGPVDVPEEDAIGPHRPILPLLPLPSSTTPGTAALRTPVERAPVSHGSVIPRVSPQPVPARPAASRSAATGPVIVPTHRPAPVPVEAARDVETDEIEGRQEPIGVSLRTLLVSAGIGLLASTALSLLALLPR